jgi:endoglucanase
MMRGRALLLALLLVLPLGAGADGQPEPVSAIRLNQLGFLPDGPKRALLPDPATTPLRWQLTDHAGAVVARGETQVLGDDAASGEHLHLIDFSAFTGAGQGYRLVVGDRGSRPFRIAANVYARLPYDALAYFYHNRSGTPIEARFVGQAWARPAGHRQDRATCISGRDQSGNVWPSCRYTLDASHGWYDAGDHGKYVVNGGIAVWTLMNAYERLHQAGSSLFADGSAAIPEAGNGVSDLLDEIRWEMDFLLSMQVPEGTHMRLPVGVRRPAAGLVFTEVDASGMAHHKIADEHWTSLPMPPHRDPERRVLHPPSTGATLNLAATAAQCARIWRGIDTALADHCLVAARRAYAAARRNPEIYPVANFTGSGGYGDVDFSDEFFWAAAELYTTTGEEAFLADLRPALASAAPVSEAGWASVRTLGFMTLAGVPNRLPQSEIAALRRHLVSAADTMLGERDGEGYRIPFAGTCRMPPGFTPPPGFVPPVRCYVWGSNAVLLNRAMILALAADFTGEARYRAGVVDVMDYLLGRNPLDQSYVSGYGSRAMANPHHRFWAHSLDPALPAAPPGALSGGPNSTSLGADPVGPTLRGHCAPQACWRDDIRAFSMNEVAVNWNAPLVWVSAWLAARQ